MAYYSDGFKIFHGEFLGNDVSLTDCPEGATAKIKLRTKGGAKAFIRHANGMFSAWYLKLDESAPKEPGRLKLCLSCPIGKNIRKTCPPPF